jgi:hypothetical protein
MAKKLSKQQILAGEAARRRNLEQEQLVGYWAKKFAGISRKDLTDHPQIDDVIMLLKIRDHLGKHFNNKESGMWGFCWSYTYNKRCHLKGKHLKKLETLVTGITKRLEQKALARQRIQAKRRTLEKPVQS